MRFTTALVVSLLYFFPAAAGRLGMCDLLLAGVPSNAQLQFQISDLETLYLEILSDSIRISNGDEAYVRQHAKNYMRKKTEFLNDALPVLRRLRAMNKPSLEMRNERDLIFTMISTLGADLKGFKILTKPYRPKIEDVVAPPPTPERPRTIGFLDHGNDDGSGPAPYFGFGNNPRNTGSDLPEGMHRSIGFGPQVIESRVQTPLRSPGKITIELTEDQNTIVVTDLLTNTVYNVKKMFMFAGDAEAEFETVLIDYDSSEHEWILRYKNLTNPEGKIGF